MQRIVSQSMSRLLRVLSLVGLAVLATVVLMRFAPGYFADSRELDGSSTARVQADLNELQARDGSVSVSLMRLIRGWSHGDLGRSRQYDVPVIELVRERTFVTCKLIMQGLALGWLVCAAAALALSARRSGAGERLIMLGGAAGLCIPVAVMATLCLVGNHGGPVLVLAAIVAVRDFKLLYRTLRDAFASSHLFYARAQGFSTFHATRVHLALNLRSELLSLLMTSLVVALSVAVPVEVIFDRPGLGQLAWASAMNRDMPVLIAVTALMATLVGMASLFADTRKPEEMACAQ